MGKEVPTGFCDDPLTDGILNSLPSLDYEAVMNAKLGFLRRLYPAQRAEVLASAAYQEFSKANHDWLVPYGVFCHLRDKFGGTDFSTWPEHRTWSEAAAALAKESSPVFDQVGFYFFVQFHLHRQLQAAAAAVTAGLLSTSKAFLLGLPVAYGNRLVAVGT